MQPLSPVPAMPSLRPVAPPRVDMSRLIDAVDAFREALSPMATALRAAGRRLNRLGAHLSRVANDPVHIAGLEARYAVRAGLDPAYRDPADLDALVRWILEHGGTDDTFAFLISPENRRRLAVAAIRGWVASYVKRGA